MSVRDTLVINGYQFEVEAEDRLYYAGIRNGLPAISSLTVTNQTGMEASNVAISVSVTSLGKQLTLQYVIRKGSIGGVPISIQNVPLVFDSGYLFDQPDVQPGEIQVSITEHDALVAEAKWPVSVMPAETWAGGSTSDFLSLAAFVQPNSPLLRPVLDAASTKMGNTGLSGYQIPAIVDPMVRAIYGAVVDLKLTYSDPPASWDVPGQKVRLPHALTAEKVATCLDSALFFASLFEQVGLYPVIGVIPGHAFVGYWTPKLFEEIGRDGVPPMPLLTSQQALTFIDQGYLHVLETTSVTGNTPADFDGATAEAHSRISSGRILGEGNSATGFVNVVAARMADPRILPLPAKVVNANGTVEIFEYKPEVASIAMLQKQLANELDGRQISATQVSVNVPPTVKVWLDQLLDLTLRNPLINMRQTDSQARLLLPKDSIGHLEDQLQAGAAFNLVTVRGQAESNQDAPALEDDRGQALSVINDQVLALFAQGVLVTHFSEAKFAGQMRKIYNQASTFQEETGSNGLYLALGSLVWKTSSGQDAESPLILLPVKLRSKARGKEWLMVMDESGVTPNFSLVEKLRQDYQLNLPHLAELKSDDVGVDVAGTFRYIREELIKAGLIDFRIDERAVLGMFNFSTYRLWRDLLDNWQKFEKKPLVGHLINTPGQAFEDSPSAENTDDLDQLISKLPISSDGSQARAISRALKGETFVLQGPPGTGKSQTIANLLARALHEGKRVLFVAQKQDAAQVVKERLKGVGLAAFTLDLHDKNLSIAAVRDQLSQVIDIAVQPDMIGFDTASSSYETAVAPLASYRSRLHETNNLGDSIYSANQKLHALPAGEKLTISGEFAGNATQEHLDQLEAAARKIAIFGPRSGTALQNPWSLADLNSSALESSITNIREALRELVTNFEAFSADKVLLEYFINSSNDESFKNLSALRINNVSDLAVRFASDPRNDFALASAVGSLRTLVVALGEIPSCGISFSKQDWSFWRTQAQLAIQGSALFRNFKLKGLQKKISLQLAAQVPGAPTALLVEIDKFEAAKFALEKATSKISEIPGLTHLNSSEFVDLDKLEELQTEIYNVQQVGEFSRSVRESGPQTKDLLHLQNSDKIFALQNFASSWRKFEELLGAKEAPKSIWLSDHGLWENIAKILPEMKTDLTNYNLSKLSDWVVLRDELETFKSLGLQDAVNELSTGAVPFDDAFNAFKRGFYTSMLDVLVATRGFSTFSGATIDAYIDQVSAATGEIRKRLPKVLGSELLEQRGFNSTVKVGAIGDLVMAIKTAKRGMTLKSMLRSHWTIIQQITPLVIASPDSCVRFIDTDLQPFDLVVFDEASQLRVASTIGAIGRANSAVVVGDSEQMPPTSVAQARFDVADDEEDQAVVLAGDSESILSMCVNARVPEIMLTWHYRSEDESLIAFSNHSYYKGNLNTLPSPSTNRPGIGLEFTPVAGQFIRSGDGSSTGAGKTLAEAKRKGTNPAEALAILAEIRRRALDANLANESVGVVTLNQQQQKYIQELLDTSDDKAVQDVMENGLGGEAIFVKNLETVQGSERDVILFSVAFSSLLGKPNDLPLQFGPIVNNGGHRRLNVAITRARKKMNVFCSFDPQKLISKKPNSRGLQDLGQFLALAKATDRSGFQVLASSEESLDLHRRDVMDALLAAGLNVREEVGLSEFKVDIAVLDPKNADKAVLAVMLDGPRWDARVTTVDRDVLPTALLKNKMEWPDVERIWLPAWLRNPEGEVERIKAAFEVARKQPGRKAKQPKAQQPEPEAVFQQIFTNDNLDHAANNPISKLFEGVGLWRELPATIVGHQDWLDHLNQNQVKVEIKNLATKLVAAEGPVSPTRLAKYIAGCFGYGRVVQNRIDAINAIFPRTWRDGEGFLYPDGTKPSDYAGWQRGDQSSARAVSEISLIEISNAMMALALATQGMREEQLLREVISAFGLKRITQAVEERLAKALKLAFDYKKLQRNGEYLVAAS